jgi:hypothetical protein
MDILRSGLDLESQCVPGETREDFTQLQADYYAHYRPTTPDARFQVDNLIRNEWLLRRFHRAESHLWAFRAKQADAHQLGEVLTSTDTTFMHLQRRITAAERAYREAKAELEMSRAIAQPEESKPQGEPPPSFAAAPSLPVMSGKKKLDWHAIRSGKAHR